jgi:hypothetical protein
MLLEGHVGAHVAVEDVRFAPSCRPVSSLEGGKDIAEAARQVSMVLEEGVLQRIEVSGHGGLPGAERGGQGSIRYPAHPRPFRTGVRKFSWRHCAFSVLPPIL